MTTPDFIRWLRQRAAAFDLRREVHARNGASLAAGIAAVQPQTLDDAADDLERAAVAETIPSKG